MACLHEPHPCGLAIQEVGGGAAGERQHHSLQSFLWKVRKPTRSRVPQRRPRQSRVKVLNIQPCSEICSEREEINLATTKKQSISNSSIMKNVPSSLKGLEFLDDDESDK